MSEIINALSEAAARGVNVTVVTSARDPVTLTLKWRFKEHRDGETAMFRGAGIELYVADYDGDGSVWQMRRGKTVLAEGSDYGDHPYHFDACLLAAEAALRAEVKRMIAEAKAKSSTTRPNLAR